MAKVQIEYSEADKLWYLRGYSSELNEDEEVVPVDWYVGDVTIFAVGVLTVPEPATSLLSLMALAGLLARRRRKAA